MKEVNNSVLVPSTHCIWAVQNIVRSLDYFLLVGLILVVSILITQRQQKTLATYHNMVKVKVNDAYIKLIYQLGLQSILEDLKPVSTDILTFVQTIRFLKDGRAPTFLVES